MDGFRVDNSGWRLATNHLQTADDELLFCNATIVEVETIGAYSYSFEVISSLRVNVRKRIMIGRGVEFMKVNKLAHNKLQGQQVASYIFEVTFGG